MQILQTSDKNQILICCADQSLNGHKAVKSAFLNLECYFEYEFIENL